MSKPKSFHACRVERIQHVTHGTLNLVSGAQTSDRTEIVTEPCKPTETGLKLIASVKG
jgi:hypothetical protein